MTMHPPRSASPWATDPRFQQEKFLLNQKVLSLGNKYYLYDEASQPLFFIDRPVLRIRGHITVYDDETKQQKRLTLFQDKLFSLMSHSFTLQDEFDQPIATMKRQGWKSLLRRMWIIYDPEGNEICRAEEDSLSKAIARRLLSAVDLNFIRTNFIITRQGQVLGEFIRRYTLTDKYLLDLSRDPQRTLDRRIAVGLSILLDNAESR